MATAPDGIIAVGNNASTLLLLADGRFPAGGHAHSGGFEATAALERLADLRGLEQYLVGRVETAGLVAAAFAAAACAAAHEDAPLERLAALDIELDARTPAPALRAASRRLGRQLVRAGRAIWPHPTLEAIVGTARRDVHQPIAFGAVAAAGGLTAGAAALAAAHDSVMGPASAAVRLLGLDPFSVHAVLARISPRVGDVGSWGAAHAHAATAELPASTAPLVDIAAEHHATWEVRLFAS